MWELIFVPKSHYSTVHGQPEIVGNGGLITDRTQE